MIILILTLFIGLLLRFLLSFTPSFQVDMNAWYAWADRLVNLNWSKFYDPNIWTHYTPGYFYILWFLGWIKKIFMITNTVFLLQLFKFPNNLADIFIAVLIYKIIAKYSKNWAIIGSILYLFNPAIIFNSSIWGQADSLLALLMLGSLYWFLKNKYNFGAIFFALAFLVKPQAVFLAPVIFIYLFKEKKIKKIILSALVFLVTILVLSWPFFPNDRLLGLPKLILQMGNDYPYTVLHAFNFWQIFGNFKLDNKLFAGISLNIIGLCLYYLVSLGLLTKVIFQKKQSIFFLFFSSTLLLFSFFLFPTRVHERYLLPMLPFLLVSGCLSQSIFLLVNYGLISLIHFINIFYVYNLYYPEFIKTSLFNNFTSFPPILSLITIIIFIVLVIHYLRNNFVIKSNLNTIRSATKKVDGGKGFSLPNLIKKLIFLKKSK